MTGAEVRSTAATRAALTAILAAPEPAYGYVLMKATGLEPGTLYPLLGRLEEAGILTSEPEDSAGVEGRPVRRLYRFAPGGRDRAGAIVGTTRRQARASFDQAAFAAAVIAVIEARGVSDREVARQAGVAGSTVNRTIRQDKRPDVDSLVCLADWAGLPLDAFAVRLRSLPATPFVADTRRIVAAQRAAASAAEALALLLTPGEGG